MRPIPALATMFLAFGLGGLASAQTENGAKFREMFIQLDANGDTVLERDEIPESGRPAFDRLLKRGDINKNGKLEADEIRDLGKKSANAGAEPGEMVAARLKTMDKDGDGKISKAEFKGIPENFSKIDADGDGSLTRGELLKFAASQRQGGAVVPAAAKAKAKAKFRAKAKAEDAKPEAKKDTEAARPESKTAAPGPLQRFKAMDKDGDGKVSKTELPREKLFDRLDANKDGFLTPDELARGKKPGA